MLDLRRRWERVWDERLRPINEGEDDKESFTEWWARHKEALAHLDPLIAEQWVYKHWSTSYTAFLPLEDVTWRRERWPADQILAQVRMEFGGPMDPEHDFRAFNGRDGFGPLPTAVALNQGSWDIPLLLLETPFGIRSPDGDFPEVRFVVAEGSKRMRYLNALRHRGEAPGPHDVFILESMHAG